MTSNNLNDLQSSSTALTNLGAASASDLAAKAPLNSPAFTGTPSLPTGTTAVTQSASDDSTKLSTTAYTDAAVAIEAARAKAAEATLTETTSPGPRPFSVLGRVVHGGYSLPSPGGLTTQAQEAAKYGILVLNQADASNVAPLKAANPFLKIFLYLDAAVIDSSDPNGTQSVVGYTLANNGSHNDWFLLHSGSRITNGSTGFPADVGLAAYQTAAVSNIKVQAATANWDGIFFDEVSTNFSFLNPSASSDLYPTQLAWQAAYYSFLTTVIPQLHSSGIKVMLNLADDANVVGVWPSWAAQADGVYEESWTDGGAGLAQQDVWWPTRFSNLNWAVTNKKFMMLNSHNSTEAGNTYGLAAMLLAADYDGNFFYDTANSVYTTETFYSEYATAAALGPSMGAFREVQYRVYLRYFAFGLVVVNTTGSTSGSVAFGRACSGSGLSSVSSTTVPAYSGYILLYD